MRRGCAWLAIASQQPSHCWGAQAGSALELLSIAGQLLVGIPFRQLFHALLHLLEQVGIGVGLAKARAKQPVDGVGENRVAWIVLMHGHGSPNDTAQAALAS